MSPSFLDLSGKTAFVTGSSRGIGLAIARALVQCGARVTLHGVRPSEKLAAAAAELGTPTVTGDLGAPDEVRALATTIGSTDILVLNGSVQSYTGIDNYSDAEFSRMMQTNVASAFQLIAAFAPGMAARHYGRIIAVSSINQLRPADRLGIYATTKAALANLILTTAKKYAAHGITANTIQPGVIVTDRNREVLANPDFAEPLRLSIPAQRFGSAEDCALIVPFLASDGAAYLTGAEIPIAGGMQL